jgi:vesicle coat complex subunit
MKKVLLVSLAVWLTGCGKKADYSVPALIELLKHKDPDKRSYAARHLKKFGAQAAPAVPALTEALTDDDKNVRMGAAYALGAIGEPAKTAIPALRQALKDSNQEVRKGAIYALKQLEDPKPQSQRRAERPGTKEAAHKSRQRRHKEESAK